MTLHFQSIRLAPLPADRFEEITPQQVATAGDLSPPLTTGILSPVVRTIDAEQTDIIPSPINKTVCSITDKDVGFVKHATLEFDSNWWAQENYGRWAKAGQASFDIVGPLQISDGASLILVGDFFQNQSQPIGLSINGKQKRRLQRDRTGRLVLPLPDMGTVERLTIDLSFQEDAKSPKELNLSEDERTLTYFLKSVEMVL